MSMGINLNILTFGTVCRCHYVKSVTLKSPWKVKFQISAVNQFALAHFTQLCVLFTSMLALDVTTCGTH